MKRKLSFFISLFKEGGRRTVKVSWVIKSEIDSADLRSFQTLEAHLTQGHSAGPFRVTPSPCTSWCQSVIWGALCLARHTPPFQNLGRTTVCDSSHHPPLEGIRMVPSLGLHRSAQRTVEQRCAWRDAEAHDLITIIAKRELLSIDHQDENLLLREDMCLGQTGKGNEPLSRSPRGTGKAPLTT